MQRALDLLGLAPRPAQSDANDQHDRSLMDSQLATPFRELALKSASGTPSGKLLLWGSNTYYQLGCTLQTVNQVLHELASPAVQVECGMYHTVVLDAQGDLYCCGRNHEGQLGDTIVGDNNQIETKLYKMHALPVQETIISIGCGRYHTAVLTEKGSVYEVGRGEKQWTKIGMPWAARSSISQVVCGGFRTIVRCEDGSVWQWGETTSRGQVARIQKLEGKIITKISCGLYQCVALTETGEVFLWTNTDAYGDSEIRPLMGVDNVNFVDVVSGKFGSAAIASSGDVWAWKIKLNGEIADKALPLSSTLLNGNFCRELACGDNHFVLLGADAVSGTPQIYTWGKNAYFQLGVEGVAEADESDPQAIIDLHGIEFSQLRCGAYHNAAITGPWSGGARFTLSSALREALRTSLLTDSELFVKGINSSRVWKVHRAILKARTGINLSAASVGAGGMIELDLTGEKDIKEDHVDSVLEYIYTDRCPMNDDAVKSISILAERFQIASLISICSARLKKAHIGSKHKRLTDYTAALLKDPVFSDISFRYEDPNALPKEEIIKAHKFIVASRCPFYNAMWRQGWKESDAAEVPVPEGCSLEAFQAFLTFIYTEKFDINGEIVVDLLSLAHQMDMNALKLACDKFLADAVDETNAVALSQVAFVYDANRLKYATSNFIATHPALKRTEEWLQLPAEVRNFAVASASTAANNAGPNSSIGPTNSTGTAINQSDTLRASCEAMKTKLTNAIQSLVDRNHFNALEFLYPHLEKMNHFSDLGNAAVQAEALKQAEVALNRWADT